MPLDVWLWKQHVVAKAFWMVVVMRTRVIRRVSPRHLVATLVVRGSMAGGGLLWCRQAREEMAVAVGLGRERNGLPSPAVFQRKVLH